ncbi:hypothetical protein NOR51B_2500 [Luminiphilus syltensis NOR5-1B]|uniref:Uncharacterized protein n=1 Tax=Luminiphilus syltensis NOR5-1B TaxID=565045 RepID=B8KWD6_9GAMM|nr:hypothetical protein NOR51B_2500 [Luminiphilus syltensis NOR5-1B]
MNHWFEGDLSLDIFDYGDLDPSVLQLVEDSISTALKPMFGKQGGNNK